MSTHAKTPPSEPQPGLTRKGRERAFGEKLLHTGPLRASPRRDGTNAPQSISVRDHRQGEQR